MPLDPTKIVKIWFSAPGEHPLGHDINVIRLYQHRMKFPKDRITLISNYLAYPEEQKRKLRTFCQEYRLTLLDVTEIKKLTQKNPLLDKADKDLQLRLLEFALLEIKHHFFASASDIIRTLSTTLTLGIYFDLDDIKTQNPESSSVGGTLGLLADAEIQCVREPNGFVKWVVGETTCNTPLGSDEQSNTVMKLYRTLLYKNYTNTQHISKTLKNLTVIDDLSTDSRRLIDDGLTLIPEDTSDTLPPLLSLKKHIQDNLDPSEYQKLIRPFVIVFSGPQVLRMALNLYLSSEPFTSYDPRSQISLAKSFIYAENPFSTHENDVSWVNLKDLTDTFHKRYSSSRESKSILLAFHAQRATHPALLPEKTEEDLAVVCSKLTPFKAVI